MKELRVKIPRDSMLRIYHELRESEYHHMLAFRETVKMRGPYATVEVDESMMNDDS